MISLKAVEKSYGRKNQLFHALSGINLTIQKGASVAIVGKSGSGKSTLMHVMSGLDRADSGEIVVDRQPLLGLKQKAVDTFRSEKIGFIFQAFFVQANESCYYNVALPLEIAGIPIRQRRKLVLEALQRVELEDKVDELARNLSGGQKQRLAIARAIVTKPQILFADEPTGNLDSKTGATIEKLLFDLCRGEGVTLVIVTHDEDLAARCDMRVYLKDGKIQRTVGKKGVRK